MQASEPQDLAELPSFLGILHYYGKFLPSLATVLQPLNNLFKADAQWVWTEVCSKAFETAKQLLVQAPVLAHYDPDLPICLAGDASAYGISIVAKCPGLTRTVLVL